MTKNGAHIQMVETAIQKHHRYSAMPWVFERPSTSNRIMGEKGFGFRRHLKILESYLYYEEHANDSPGECEFCQEGDCTPHDTLQHAAGLRRPDGWWIDYENRQIWMLEAEDASFTNVDKWFWFSATVDDCLWGWRTTVVRYHAHCETFSEWTYDA